MGQPARELPPSAGPTPLEQAGLEPTELSGRNLTLGEVPRMTLLRLHSLEEPDALATALTGSGIELPLETNAAGGDDPAALCLRPGEWLLLSESRTAADVDDDILPRLDPELTTLLDLSDGLGVFRLTGAASPWLLCKLSGLDFLTGIHSRRHGARTRLGEIAVVVIYSPEAGREPRFELVFDRSVAKYLWDLLCDAAPHADNLHSAHGGLA